MGFRFRSLAVFYFEYDRKETIMYQSPRAERLLPESEEVMNVDLLLASSENDETDNNVSIDDLLGGLK